MRVDLALASRLPATQREDVTVDKPMDLSKVVVGLSLPPKLAAGSEPGFFRYPWSNFRRLGPRR